MKKEKTKDQGINNKTKPIRMKIVVIGGTGLIGTKLVNKLRELGHEVVAASCRC